MHRQEWLCHQNRDARQIPAAATLGKDTGPLRCQGELKTGHYGREMRTTIRWLSYTRTAKVCFWTINSLSIASQYFPKKAATASGPSDDLALMRFLTDRSTWFWLKSV